MRESVKTFVWDGREQPFSVRPGTSDEHDLKEVLRYFDECGISYEVREGGMPGRGPVSPRRLSVSVMMDTSRRTMED